MKKLIFVNLKMYLNNQTEVNNYLSQMNDQKDKFIVFPPAIYLDRFIKKNYTCGIQNISVHKHGSHTGETSAISIKDLGANYVLLGHSEIRQSINEDDAQINLKIKNALNHHLKVVLCIGEDRKSYNQNKTKEILKKQLTEDLKDIKEEIIISYEPIWAIGSGQTPTNEEIADIVNYIKNNLNNVKVLYGGSVSETNIEKLNQIKNLDGFLIGRSGADPSSLNKIIEVVCK